ncbi:MAG: hypothetical protein Q4B87_02480 [Candidatus Saccharibacteria bacterium]|nr:hypothetical protein [Candidatus Saccharibacteria bacterium]
MRKKHKERVRPMPTDEEKERAKLKAAGADPLVWAMKSVDDKFPDAREKDAKTIKAEAEVEMLEGDTDEEDVEIDSENISGGNASQEIKAEDKLTMPVSEGVVTMEVTPMRQDVSEVSPDEVKKNREAALDETAQADDKKVVNKVVGKTDEKIKNKFGKKLEDEKKVNVVKKTSEHKTQVKLSSLESRQKGMIIAMIALALIAIGGVTFGIVAMVKQGEAKEELKEQIQATSNENGENIDSEYIYLKDWNLKIKILPELTNLSYNVQNDDFAEVQIWGAKKDTSANYVPDFAKQSNNSDALGTVVRIPRYERGAAGRLIWYDDYYNYYYQGPSGVPNVSENEMSWWTDSYLKIKEMLTNADNYAAIE